MTPVSPGIGAEGIDAGRRNSRHFEKTSTLSRRIRGNTSDCNHEGGALARRGGRRRLPTPFKNPKGAFLMFARMLTFLTLVTFVGAPAAARSADAAKNATPTIIVRVDSINNLLEDVK